MTTRFGPDPDQRPPAAVDRLGAWGLSMLVAYGAGVFATMLGALA
jgi:hypothetical protein